MGFEVCGVAEDMFRSICSAVDKLDKAPWEEVRKEMVDEKGLEAEAADRIGEWVQMSGGQELVEKLLGSKLAESAKAKAGLEDMALLLRYCNLYGCSDSVRFDPKGRSVPCVGVSIGIERLFSIMETNLAKQQKAIRTVDTQVYVVSAQKQLMEERMKLVDELWAADIRTEHSYKKNPKLLSQLQYCEENSIPIAVMVGTSELEKGVVKLRDVATRAETEVTREDLVATVRGRLTLNPEVD